MGQVVLSLFMPWTCVKEAKSCRASSRQVTTSGLFPIGICEAHFLSKVTEQLPKQAPHICHRQLDSMAVTELTHL